MIVLLRDPRGILKSRADIEWCNGDCRSPAHLCSLLSDNLAAAHDLSARHPGRVYVVRYEDLALDPDRVYGRVLRFLGQKRTQGVDEFIRTNTKGSTER